MRIALHLAKLVNKMITKKTLTESINQCAAFMIDEKIPAFLADSLKGLDLMHPEVTDTIKTILAPLEYLSRFAQPGVYHLAKGVKHEKVCKLYLYISQLNIQDSKNPAPGDLTDKIQEVEDTIEVDVPVASQDNSLGQLIGTLLQAHGELHNGIIDHSHFNYIYFACRPIHINCGDSWTRRLGP